MLVADMTVEKFVAATGPLSCYLGGRMANVRQLPLAPERRTFRLHLRERLPVIVKGKPRLFQC
jgi:hypothetical protein